MLPLIGCCGWAGSQSRYFSQFPVIEIQSTFYDPPASEVAARWRAIAPAGFAFCIKAWQLITHTPSSPTYRRLRCPVKPQDRDSLGSFRDTEGVWRAWEKTREIAEVLQAKVVVFQCPASFRATPENLRNISLFFRKIGTQPFRMAWEPRGPWPPELIHELCKAHGLIHCVDPFVNRSVYGDALYWRLHGKASYSYRYADEDLDHLKRMLLLEQHPAYILFNNFSMKEDAGRFGQILQQASG